MFDIVDGKLHMSVRAFVEFFCRGGNIDNRFGGISDKNAMDAGRQAHIKIQKAMGSEYQSEVPLRYVLPQEDYEIILDGRADGIFNKDGFVFVDEIKGTYQDIKHIHEPVKVHKAQAMCYAFFYARDNSLDKIGVRMTYVSLEDDLQKKYFEEILTIQEIEKWFMQYIDQLIMWGNMILEHKLVRDKSISGLKFPYEFREGQRELAESVYKSIGLDKNLFIQAPTGVGKTLSTVYPSIMAVGNNKANKIFYLTAKTITRTAAEEAYSLLRGNGLVFKTVTLTAKEKICFTPGEEGPKCNPVDCPYARGHYDRINEAVFDIITHEEVISRSIIEEYALKHQVCPFEFTLDISYFMDGIICDYNYVFDPHVFLKRFFADGVAGKYVFLIDEAHNLVDRAREMYSAPVFKDAFLATARLVKGHGKRLENALNRCNKNMLAIKRTCDEQYVILDDIDLLAHNMRILGEELSLFMEKHRDFEHNSELLDLFFDVMHFNEMYDLMDENYMTYAEHTDNGFMVKLLCVNPSQNLKLRLDKGVGTVFFSATLLPINYYKELLSGNMEDYAIYARTPFDPDNKLLAIGRDVTSRYTRRNETEYRKIATYIEKTVTARKGNYLVFFPSYKYMYDVKKQLSEDEGVAYIMQEKIMDEEAREAFLESFDNNTGDRTLVGLCVMGGIFSEGIDLKEDRLIGALIVGTGLPAINTESDLYKLFFDNKDGLGYEYAYVYPGMNKVLQAAGRVIRTESDRGVILLLDDRFGRNDYQKLFPNEWNNYHFVTMDTVMQEIIDFWE